MKTMGALRRPFAINLFVASGGLVLLAGLASPNRAAAQADTKRPAAKSTTPATKTQDEDRTAIEAALASFAKAFESADAKALAAHWTVDGEYNNASGVRIHGRDALEASFAGFFQDAPEPKAELHPDSVRFLSTDSAIAQGTVAVRRGPAEPARRADYTALFVREGGIWRIGQLRETDRQQVSIEDLSWLIGEWKSLVGERAEIHTTYAFDASKKFIHVRFALREATIGFTGTQIIGIDPATGQLHSWTFEATGGVGEADWETDGDHWQLDAVGSLPDGRTLREINVLRRINDDTITWQSVERTIDDVVIPDLPPVKVTRVKAAK